MRAETQVLSADECSEVHERTLAILAGVGMRIDSEKGREILAAHGAAVDAATGIAKFPPAFVEECLARVTRRFSLGGSRPGWEFPLNAGRSTLIASGEAPQVLDSATGEPRDCSTADWREATRLLNAIDDVGVYWQMMTVPGNESLPERVQYFADVARLFTKHLQESFSDPAIAPHLREILQVAVGDSDEIRRRHPLSFLLTPVSPLSLERSYTDSWLAMRGLDIPVSILPMPQMGATAPASPLATILLANCEVLGTLCLVQCAEPGVPVIYSPVPIVMDPRSGSWTGVAPHSLAHVATTQMARHYGLPATASACDTDHFVPGAQAGIEKGISALMAVLGGADLLVGPGVLGNATVWSREQLVIDIETFRICHFLREGVPDGTPWLDDLVAATGPGGNFVGERSTRTALRDGTWFLPRLGWHSSRASWDAAGRPGLLEQAGDAAASVLAMDEPWRLDEDADLALEEICRRAKRTTVVPG
jgi:trimethylamine--corrinoid protein Co-methyltransferase